MKLALASPPELNPIRLLPATLLFLIIGCSSTMVAPYVLERKSELMAISQCASGKPFSGCVNALKTAGFLDRGLAFDEAYFEIPVGDAKDADKGIYDGHCRLLLDAQDGKIKSFDIEVIPSQGGRP